ncbi:hypothetical protein AAG570_008930 [Ranatra chinensis]|uniref:Receptor L-domain domain-containing protein n=1 Tax=Ranatra chinensis TaxID=642074 RepID=A0ABD0Z9E1_9HEMI
MDIKNRASNLSVLKDCNVIEGYLRIVLMEKTTVDDFKDLSFPELREVTGNIIFYRVRGLTSIGRLFPNLRVIRGEDLFMYYSLVVYKMFSLKEIALPGLTVLRGGVIISENRGKSPVLFLFSHVKINYIPSSK